MRLANANLIRREDKLKILDKINSDISNNMEKSPVRNSTNKYDSNNNFNSEYYNLNSIGNEFVPEERSIFSVERKTHTNIFAKSITGKRVSSMSITSVKLQESNKFPIPITNGEFKNLNNSNSGKIINTRYSTNVKLTKQQIDFYVPCINCNNQIKFDEIGIYYYLI